MESCETQSYCILRACMCKQVAIIQLLGYRGLSQHVAKGPQGQQIRSTDQPTKRRNLWPNPLLSCESYTAREHTVPNALPRLPVGVSMGCKGLAVGTVLEMITGPFIDLSDEVLRPRMCLYFVKVRAYGLLVVQVERCHTPAHLGHTSLGSDIVDQRSLRVLTIVRKPARPTECSTSDSRSSAVTVLLRNSSVRYAVHFCPQERWSTSYVCGHLLEKQSI